jgi:peroxiredoxin Q/BCP
MLSEGQKAPDFSLPASDGSIFKLKNMTGKKAVILYFYPKNNIFACPSKKVFELSKSIVDSYSQIKRVGAEVYGISVDKLDSHVKFANEFNIPYLLLSDQTKEVCKMYAGLNLFGLAKRTVVIIGNSGIILRIIRNVEPVSIGNNILDILNSNIAR